MDTAVFRSTNRTNELCPLAKIHVNVRFARFVIGLYLLDVKWLFYFEEESEVRLLRFLVTHRRYFFHSFIIPHLKAMVYLREGIKQGFS